MDQARLLRPGDRLHRNFQAHRAVLPPLSERELFAGYGIPVPPAPEPPDWADREPAPETELELRAAWDGNR